eukprot:6426047-Lingulodinium_polyedra.AAC.1
MVGIDTGGLVNAGEFETAQAGSGAGASGCASAPRARLATPRTAEGQHRVRRRADLQRLHRAHRRDRPGAT